MDFRFTPEEEALRKEFDDFFRKSNNIEVELAKAEKEMAKTGSEG